MKLYQKVIFHVLLLIFILNIVAISTNGFFDSDNIVQEEPKLGRTGVTLNSDVKRTNGPLTSPKPRDITQNTPSEEEKSPRSAAETDSRSLKSEKTGPTLLGGSVTSWANTSFHYRKNFTIDHNKVSADLTDFPVLINIVDADLRRGKVQDDGDDIMFTNATGTRLAHEIETFQQSSSLGVLVGWARVPTLSSTTDTILSMYYGNDTLPSQENATGVWDSGFAGVWHLAENPVIYPTKDSTANDNAGTPHGTTIVTTSKVGYGFRFNRLAQDYIDIGNPAELRITGALTFEGWFYTGNPDRDQTIIAKWADTYQDMGWELRTYVEGPGIVEFRYSADGNNAKWAGEAVVSANQWYHVAGVFNPSSYVRLYLNGQMVSQGTVGIPAGLWDTSESVTFGKRTGATNYFDGTLDEIRISNVTRSAAWIGTYYNNTNNPTSFYTIGSEDVYDVTVPIVDDFGVDDDGTGNPRFWANVSDPFGAVDNATIRYEGTEYPMSLNGTGHWIYTPATVTYDATVSYQIVNAADIYGNYLTEESTIKTHDLNYDTVAPSIGTNDWYHDPDIGLYGTTYANATDAWGVIDTVIVNVTFAGGIPRNNLSAIMRPTASGYINDTLKMDRGIIYVEFIANDTAGNSITLGPFFGFAGPNDPPEALNVAFTPSSVRSNESLQLSYDYSDLDEDPEAGTQIRWYKNGELQSTYNDLLLIPAAALIKGDQWNATVTPKDGRNFGVPAWSPTISVQNVAPEVLALDFVNRAYAAFLVEDEDLNVSYSFSDNDNDPDASIIHWYINRVYNATYDNQTFIPANQSRPGEVWSFEVLPFDGTDYGLLIKSQEITIESRPSIDDYGVTPLQDADGNYEFWVLASDPRNTIFEAKFQIFSDGIQIYDLPVLRNGTHWKGNYTFDLTQTPLYSTMRITITITSSVASSGDEISSTTTFNLTIEDKAPPRVSDAIYYWDDDNPVNITFEVEIMEKGSGIAEIIVFYAFSSTGEIPEASEAPSLFNGEGYLFNGMRLFEMTQVEKNPYNLPNNATLRHLHTSYWGITVPFNPKSDVDVLFTIFVMDNDGNSNSDTFPQGMDPDWGPSFTIGGSEGLDLMFVLGLLAIVAVVFAIGSIVAIRMWRTTELVGLDKERVWGSMGVIEEDEAKSALALHTLGVVVSFFDQRHGPIPIIIVPELLRDNYDKLVDLSDQSFSVCQFMDNFEHEKFAIFDFTLAPGLSINSISFAFALERPNARGGSENITLNILVQPNVFPLVSQFVDHFSQKVHEIHVFMDKSPSRRDKILEMIADLRMQISYVVLSYERLYGTTELLSEEDDI